VRTTVGARGTGSAARRSRPDGHRTHECAVVEDARLIVARNETQAIVHPGCPWSEGDLRNSTSAEASHHQMSGPRSPWARICQPHTMVLAMTRILRAECRSTGATALGSARGRTANLSSVR
jgi:hypothetical protein